MKRFDTVFFLVMAVLLGSAFYHFTSNTNAAETGAPPRVVPVEKFEDLPDKLLQENANSIFAVKYGATAGDGLGGLFIYSSGATNTVDNRDAHYSFSGTGRLIRIDQSLPLKVGPDVAQAKESTIASGVITPAAGSYFTIDTESDAASDNLDTILATNFKPGDIVIVQANNTARTVVLKDGTGNLKLSGDFSLDNTEDTAQLLLIGTNWVQVATSNNGS